MDPSIAIPGYGLIEAFFTVGGTMLIGFFLGYVCVGLFVYDYVDDDFETEMSEEERQNKEDIKYINLYYDEFEEMEEIELDDDALKELHNLYADEETSRGRVCLTYNSETESFWYWTDNKNINYRILDTVARKFSLDYNCKQVCVSYKNELNSAYDKIREEKERKLKEAEENENANENDNLNDAGADVDADADSQEKKEVNVFAQFKNYNVRAANNDNKEKDPNQKQYVLAEKANRFSYKGTIEDYEKMQNKKEAPEEERSKKIDFATFKKMILRSDAKKPISEQPVDEEQDEMDNSTDTNDTNFGSNTTEEMNIGRPTTKKLKML